MLVHEDPVFRLVLPAGYRSVPVQTPGTILSHARHVGPNPLDSVAFAIEIMPGPTQCAETETSLAALQKGLPPGGQVQFSHLPWGRHTLTVIERRFPQSELDFFTLTAHVPLRSRAIHVTLGGVSSLEREVREDLRRVLESLEGPSPWPLETRHRVATVWATLTAVLLALEWLLRFRKVSAGVARARGSLCYGVTALFGSAIPTLIFFWRLEMISVLELLFGFLAVAWGAWTFSKGGRSCFRAAKEMEKAGAMPASPS